MSGCKRKTLEAVPRVFSPCWKKFFWGWMQDRRRMGGFWLSREQGFSREDERECTLSHNGQDEFTIKGLALVSFIFDCSITSTHHCEEIRPCFSSY